MLGSGFGWVLLDGSCDATYYGDKLGYWDDSCALKDYPPHLEETLVDERARKKALDYIGNHKSRVPVVVAARIGTCSGTSTARSRTSSSTRSVSAAARSRPGRRSSGTSSSLPLVDRRSRRTPTAPHPDLPVPRDRGRDDVDRRAQLRHHTVPSTGRRRHPGARRGRPSTPCGGRPETGGQRPSPSSPTRDDPCARRARGSGVRQRDPDVTIPTPRTARGRPSRRPDRDPPVHRFVRPRLAWSSAAGFASGS